MHFKVGDIVWVPASSSEDEEPGTVLRVDCGRHKVQDDHGVVIVYNGVLVKRNISLTRNVFDPCELRLWAPETAPMSRRSRSLVTPSPDIVEIDRVATRPQAVLLEDKNDDKKPAAKRKVETSPSISPFDTEFVQVKKRNTKAEPDCLLPLASPYFAEKDDLKTTEHVPSFAVASSSTTARSSTKTKSGRARQKINASPFIEADESSDEEPSTDDDSDAVIEGVDRPYTVEYAPTQRSVCRRCDEVIAKNSLRVSHVPLFRGKPGYTVYRHLCCAVFSEEVNSVADVAGWRSLSKSDLEALERRIQDSKLEVAHENEELQPDELVQEAFKGELRPAPPGLKASLLPFQAEGVSWMYCQEVSNEVRGGILADEMGMGKSIQQIVTILDNRPLLQRTRPGSKHPPSSTDIETRIKEEALWKKASEEWSYEMDMNGVPKKLRPKSLGSARAGTLVVCPVIALSHWAVEFEKFTEPNTLKVGIYHGPNRAKDIPADKMKDFDIILTTYQVLEQDFRKMVSPNKIACPNCGGKFKIDKLRVHLKYFCGDGARRTEAQSRQKRTATRHEQSPKNHGNMKKQPVNKVMQTKNKAVSTVSRKEPVVHLESDDGSASEIELPKSNALRETKLRRPSRSAARSASAKLREWGTSRENVNDDDDESSFASSSEAESDSTEESADASTCTPQPLASTKRAMKKKHVTRSKDEGTTQRKKIDQSVAIPAVQRAMEKQKKALETAKKSSSTNKNIKKKPDLKGSKKKVDQGASDSDASLDENPATNELDMDDLMEAAMAGARFSPLHTFCWWRIVLDEAHMIKSRASQTAAAAFALTAVHRWCMSGTPLQNRVGELYSLIRFLRIEPMAHYFCKVKGCGCKSIHFRMKSGKCQDCGHRSFSHYAHFNRYILNPIQRDGYTGDGRRAMFKLKNEVLDKCLLRRTKASRAEDLALPPRIVTIRTIRLHPIEEDFYQALYTQTKSSFDDYVAQGTLLNNYAHIFDLLTKMRQSVDHPYLIIYSKSRSMSAPTNKAPVANGSIDCDICHEPPTDRIVSSCCGSGFCRSCVIDYLTGSGVETGTPCPSCRAPFTIDLRQAGTDSQVDDSALIIPNASSKMGVDAKIPSLKELPHVGTSSILRRINLADFATSTKIEALVQELIQMRKERPGSKALVFSQFVNMLDLVRWRLYSDPLLNELDLGVRILHGGMDVKSRDRTLKEFREESNVRIMLMSLKAAGVALNLTVASEVYLLDPWWNEANEAQGIDRTHRMGQYRPIRAVRFIAEGTVEERVVQLQEKKRLVFDGTIGRDAGSLQMLGVEDMKALFA